jgi:hypothetical protein
MLAISISLQASNAHFVNPQDLRTTEKNLPLMLTGAYLKDNPFVGVANAKLFTPTEIAIRKE